jgi:nucleoside-diphosphate-sugar epimerase
MTSHLARRPTLLIVGCGDIGLRVVRALAGRLRVIALTSSRKRAPSLRAAGAIPVVGDLDEPASLGRLAGLAQSVLYLAPPPSTGRADPRMAALLAALARRRPPRRLVYASTTGVYGDCRGDRVAETRTPRPATDRAHRRLDAERRVRAWARATGARATILRVPGIYAPDREGGRPQDRLLRGTPSLRPEDDAWTNRIHADDLARACVAALWRGRAQRVVQVRDESDMKAGDWQDLVADLVGWPRPERLSRAQAAERLSATTLSFLDESRRLDDARMRRELRLALRWPTVRDALISAAARATAAGAATTGS